MTAETPGVGSPETAAARAPVPAPGQNFGWLLENFRQTVPGVRHTLAVSSDGLLMAVSAGLDRTSGDQLAAVVAGLSSLTRGAARHLAHGEVRQCVLELDTGFLFLMSISDGAVLAVDADAEGDPGLIGYEMALLARRAQGVLTPALISELRDQLPTDGATRLQSVG